MLTGENHPYATPKMHIYMKPRQVHNFRERLSGFEIGTSPLLGWSFLNLFGENPFPSKHLRREFLAKRPNVPIIVLRNVFLFTEKQNCHSPLYDQSSRTFKKIYIFVCTLSICCEVNKCPLIKKRKKKDI